jgi:hypothetical protein
VTAFMFLQKEGSTVCWDFAPHEDTTERRNTENSNRVETRRNVVT